MKSHEANQRAFDKVVRHLLKQGEKSVRNGRCLYRGPGGLMCAIGCLLDENEYDAVMDGSHASIGVTRLRIEYDPPSLRGLDGGLLSDLQGLHDSSEPVAWQYRLRQIAVHYGLTMPEVTMPEVAP